MVSLVNREGLVGLGGSREHGAGKVQVSGVFVIRDPGKH
jgi:hypothetical protein